MNIWVELAAPESVQNQLVLHLVCIISRLLFLFEVDAKIGSSEISTTTFETFVSRSNDWRSLLVSTPLLFRLAPFSGLAVSRSQLFFFICIKISLNFCTDWPLSLLGCCTLLFPFFSNSKLVGLVNPQTGHGLIQDSLIVQLHSKVFFDLVLLVLDWESHKALECSLLERQEAEDGSLVALATSIFEVSSSLLHVV